MIKHTLLLFFLCSCFSYTTSLSFANPADENSLAYTLQKAAGKGDIKTVDKLLQQKKRFEDTDYYYGKIMAFVEAAKFGRHDIMRLLLQHDVQVDDVNDGEDMTALSAAASKGKLKTMRLLLDLGAQINNRPDPGGRTPLMYATKNRQVKAMQLLLTHGAEVNTYDDSGRTALMYAAESGSLPAVKLLLKYKADINLRPTEENYYHFTDTMAWTPLMYAAYNGHLPVVQWLVKNGATVQAKAKGRTAFTLACKGKHLPIAKLLLTKGAQINAEDDREEVALILAAEAGTLDLAQWLLEQGADVNAQSNSGAQEYASHTALMQASLYGHTEMVKLLLKYKADVSKKNKKNATALMLAQREGHAKIAVLLGSNEESARKKTKNKDAPDAYQWEQELSNYLEPQQGETLEALLMQYPDNFNTSLYTDSALITAIVKNYPQAVKLLLKHGAYVDKNGVFGYTPLILAAARQDIPLVKLLLAHKARVDNLDDGGNTAFAHAAWKGNVEILQLLLDAQAPINAQPIKGTDYSIAAMTPLMFACMEKHPEAVKFLLEKGADVNLVDAWGDTALIHALEPTRWKLFGKSLGDHGYTYSSTGQSRQIQIWPEWFSGKYHGRQPQYEDVPVNTDIIKLLLQYGVKVSSKAQEMVKDNAELKTLLSGK